MPLRNFRLLLSLLIFMWLTSSSASAQTFKIFTTPEYSGYAFTFKYPEKWFLTAVYERSVVLTSPVVNGTDAHVSIWISAWDLMKTKAYIDGQTGPEDWQNPESFDKKYLRRHIDNPDGINVFDSRPISFLNQSGLFRATAPKMRYVRKLRKRVKTTNPIQHEYHAVVDGRLHAELKASARGLKAADALRALKHEVEIIAKSIKARRLSSMSEEEIARLVPTYYDSKNIRISQRRGYTLDVALVTVTPPGWEFIETQKALADAQNERGEFVAEAAPPQKHGKQPAAKLTIVLVGMPVKPITKKDFIVVRNKYVSQIIQKSKELDTTQMDLRGLRRLASLHPRRFESTGRTIVSTFLGRSHQGKEMKVRTYTTGGMTVAAYFIYSAPTDSYEKTLPAIEEMIRLTWVHLSSPSIAP